MVNRIEEAFNDCYERLLLGESLDSCLTRYPEHAVELDLMLRTAYDVRRRVYPVQPRPEFKYWSRVRLQGVQDYMIRQPAPVKASPFNFRRNLAISVAGLLVLVMASSGTVAASYEALPDQPLYGVKMAVEQAQLTLAVADVDKAEVYASLAGKRAHEIEALARQGKSDYLVATSAKMDYQLEQAETYIGKFQAASAPVPAAAAAAAVTTPAGTSAAGVTDQPAETSTVDIPAAPVPPVPTVPTIPTVPAPTTLVKPPFLPPDVKTGTGQQTVKGPLPPLQGAVNVNKAKTALNSSTAKSLTALQDALDKAPESARPAINKAIERVKKANEWSQHKMNEEQEDREDKEETNIQRPNTLPVKPLPDALKPKRDSEGYIIPADKPKYIPPKDDILPHKDPLPLNNPVSPNTVVPGGINNPTTDHEDADEGKPPLNLPSTQIQVPVTPVITNTTNTVNSTGIREGSYTAPTTKVFSK